MIEVFEGRLGGGKTYSAVLRMLDVWRCGGVVYTNVAVRWDAIRQYAEREMRVRLVDDQLVRLDDDSILEFHRRISRRSFVVLDEAHLWFNARDWAHTSRELLCFLTQSRKYAVDIVFISQSAHNLDKQFMRLVQWVWRFRDMETFVWPGIGRLPIKRILQLRFDYTLKEPLERRWVPKRPEIFQLYDTNAVYRWAYALQDQKDVHVERLGIPARALYGWAALAGVIAGFIW